MNSLVITTIAKTIDGTLLSALDLANELGVRTYLVLDKKSGNLIHSKSSILNCEEQVLSQFELARRLPWNSYSRKNIGYLAAINDGSEWILETDDDNLPSQSFFKLNQNVAFQARQILNTGWVNFYRMFGNNEVWPRGFPLNEILQADKPPEFVLREVTLEIAPVFQVIADLDPDVDAIFRLTRSLPQNFEHNLPVFISHGAVTPFNSQATWWNRRVAQLAYFPSLISWRVADIWRSLIAQRILQCRGEGVLFFGPLVKQIRNSHDLMKDFVEELPCYLNSGKVWNVLEKLPDQKLSGDFETALLNCYMSLVEADLIPREEIGLLEIWFKDFLRALE